MSLNHTGLSVVISFREMRLRLAERDGYILLALAAVLLAVAPASGGEQATDSPPDLTKTIDFEKTGEYYLGPTGAKGWMHVDAKFMTDDARQILITEVQEGSPADGVLQVGDVILGAGGKRFDGDARKCLGRAIDEAEKKENRGILKLIRWRGIENSPTRQGKEQVVEIPLAVMGTYSDTAPYDCPKTKRLLDDALQSLVASEDWSIFGIKALALLATGEQKYVKTVHDFLHEAKWAGPDFEMSLESGGLVVWGAGYRNLVLTEYYLATGDKYVLPAIREHAVKSSMGQSNGGAWGHGFAWTSMNDGRLHGNLGGYGAVNQAGLPCLLALLLSKKCGVEHAEVDDAIVRSRQFFKQFVGNGSIGYGYHRPSLEIHCNGRNGMSGNGKNGVAAVAFGLLGDRPAERFFSKLTVSLHNTCEYGHSGNSYSYFWDPLGANYGGPAAAAAFHKQLRWYYALTRQTDGSFVNQSLGGHYGRGTLDATVAQVLMMTSPRRAIYLTGKDQDKRLWLDDEDVVEAVDAARWRRADTDDVSADELIGRLDNWSPIAREWIAMALAEKQGDLTPRLVTLLESNKPEARAGACAALGHLGERAADAVPAVSQSLADKESIVRIAAGYALARMKKPAGKAIPNLLQAILAEQEEAPMKPTQQALSYSLGHAPGRVAPLYFSGVLANLAEDGNPIEGVDRKLLYASVTKLLKDPSGRVRGCGAYALNFFTREDLAAMAGPIYDAIETPAPNYAMFDDAPRQYGLDLMARLRIAEGIPLCIETIQPKKWGQGMRLPHRFETLQKYGGAARSLLPQLKEMRWTLKTSEHRQPLEDAIRAIEADENPQPLVSLHTLVDERLDRDLSSATDDRQRVRLCRELMKVNADDNFYQAAALRRLVAILGADALGDVLQAIDHEDKQLRETAVTLRVQVTGDHVSGMWAGQLRDAPAEKAAELLDMLARRGDPKMLRLAKTYVTHKDTVVRAAAIRAVATLGSEKDVDQGAALLAAIGGTTPEAKVWRIRIFGQLAGNYALDAVTAATRDEDASVSQTAFDALATSPNPRATEVLVAMIAEPPTPKLKAPAYTACLRRVITGQAPQRQKIAMLAKLLALDDRGRNASAALAELAWPPSIASLNLAQSYLDRQGLTDPAASAVVAIAQKLDMNDPKQRKAAVAALKRVVDATNNEKIIADAKELIVQHGG
ncbi:MAG: HEAT repeat domain-containing protein [Candidatus Nealsonbacteria bacterium]|nr:HEAT repeat domain-containing protein [Candidatus Nealsonbacteria bacterium]